MTDETQTADERTDVSLDLCFEGQTLEEAIADVKERYGVEVEVLQEHGPGGGWPFVSLSGTPDQLRKALREYWDLDDKDLAGYGL